MIVVRLLVLLAVSLVYENDAARILAVYPTPSISHQVVFRPLTIELLKRGHEVVVITTDPIFPKGKVPANLTEIDFHDRSYQRWRQNFVKSSVTQGSKDDFKEQNILMYKILMDVLRDQITSVEVQNILKNKSKKFDLLLLEAYLNPLLALTHVIKAPVIQISSFGSTLDNLEVVGASTHPILYPTIDHQKVYNLTYLEKISEFYMQRYFQYIVHATDEEAVLQLKETLGSDLPDLNELKNNVDMLFLNVHPIWELNRPVPPNVIYMGGLHQNPEKELPKDLKEYLDSSKNGVIYISFGTNVNPSLLPPNRIQTMVNVLAKLPYDILWKWNTDELPGRTSNIKISKWLPQSDLLKHPKIKLFITQGGLQSTDETITAGVPVIGMPMLGDQWYNVEQYVFHKVGVRLELETITEDNFQKALDEVLNNDSYRQNMLRLRTVMRDQPQTPLERAVWWTEYVIRNGGARHLRSPGANISWYQYFELELLLTLLSVTVILLSILSYVTCKVYKCIKINFVGKQKTS
ncbi:unnamed protein product [Diatraea saccharalis]|uniref:UDP-glucuronosyltransferase n=1 Tax=Diatraea saccharalis TaxID=40085 RepID=A0A9N9R9Y6_9NEOP|nr:unnamed protein product [Diatraea saccharalis]